MLRRAVVASLAILLATGTCADEGEAPSASIAGQEAPVVVDASRLVTPASPEARGPAAAVDLESPEAADADNDGETTHPPVGNQGDNHATDLSALYLLLVATGALAALVVPLAISWRGRARLFVTGWRMDYDEHDFQLNLDHPPTNAFRSLSFTVCHGAGRPGKLLSMCIAVFFVDPLRGEREVYLNHWLMGSPQTVLPDHPHIETVPLNIGLLDWDVQHITLRIAVEYKYRTWLFVSKWQTSEATLSLRKAGVEVFRSSDSRSPNRKPGPRARLERRWKRDTPDGVHMDDSWECLTPEQRAYVLKRHRRPPTLANLPVRTFAGEETSLGPFLMKGAILVIAFSRAAHADVAEWHERLDEATRRVALTEPLPVYSVFVVDSTPRWFLRTIREAMMRRRVRRGSREHCLVVDRVVDRWLMIVAVNGYANVAHVVRLNSNGVIRVHTVGPVHEVAVDSVVGEPATN